MGEILLETPRLTVICHFNYSCILNQCKHMLFKFGKIIAVKFSNDKSHYKITTLSAPLENYVLP